MQSCITSKPLSLCCCLNILWSLHRKERNAFDCTVWILWNSHLQVISVEMHHGISKSKTQQLISFSVFVFGELQRKFKIFFPKNLVLKLNLLNQCLCSQRLLGVLFVILVCSIQSSSKQCLNMPGNWRDAIKFVGGTIISHWWACSCDCWHICLSVQGKNPF